jgi:hypothetical protein
MELVRDDKGKKLSFYSDVDEEDRERRRRCIAMADGTYDSWCYHWAVRLDWGEQTIPKALTHPKEWMSITMQCRS